MAYRKEKTEKIIREIAATFIEKESGPQSLITVTRVETRNRERTATIYLNVMPKDKEDVVMQFLSRKVTEFKEYLRDNSRLSSVPFTEFKLDRI